MGGTESADRIAPLPKPSPEGKGMITEKKHKYSEMSKLRNHEISKQKNKTQKNETKKLSNGNGTHSNASYVNGTDTT